MNKNAWNVWTLFFDNGVRMFVTPREAMRMSSNRVLSRRITFIQFSPAEGALCVMN